MIRNISRVNRGLLQKRLDLVTVTCQRFVETQSENVKPVGWDEAKPYHQIPGPKSIPIFGNLWHFLPIVGKYSGLSQHIVNIRQHEEYGDVVLMKDMKISNDMVLVFNPKDIETVFRNEGPYPERDILNSIKKYRLETRKDIYEGYGGVFVADGEDWQSARSKVNPIMMKPRTVLNYVEAMDRIAKDFVENMRQLAAEDPNSEMPENFINEIHKWALESIAFVAFDDRLGAMSRNLSPDSEQQQFINNVLKFFDLMYKVEILPTLSKVISTPTWREYIRTMDNMTDFIVKQVQKRMSTISLDKPDNEMSILEKLLKIHRRFALGTIGDMLTGGVDTTGRTMAAMLYYLSVNLEAQNKLRAEIMQILPEKDSVLTGQKLESMPYMKAVIKESMRMAPITVGTVRKTCKDLVLSGYQIPKGTHVILSQIAVFWKEEHFPQAKKFIPDRWLRVQGKRENINPWVYLPFGFGPRICVGRRLAQIEMESLLVNVIRNFKLSWKHEEMSFKMDMLYGIASPLKLHIEPLTS